MHWMFPRLDSNLVHLFGGQLGQFGRTTTIHGIRVVVAEVEIRRLVSLVYDGHESRLEDKKAIEM